MSEAQAWAKKLQLRAEELWEWRAEDGTRWGIEDDDKRPANELDPQCTMLTGPVWYHVEEVPLGPPKE